MAFYPKYATTYSMGVQTSSGKIDDFAKCPHAALRRILRHCSVPQVRFIPQDLRALPANILQSCPKIDFLREHQD